MNKQTTATNNIVLEAVDEHNGHSVKTIRIFVSSPGDVHDEHGGRTNVCLSF